MMIHRSLIASLIVMLTVAGFAAASQPTLRPSAEAEVGVPEPQVYLPLIAVPKFEPAFEASPTTGYAPLAVSFTNQSTGDYAASLWDFGDGETSTSQNASHTYTSLGVYSVTLTISRATASASLTRVNYITVTSPLENGSFEDGWDDLPPVGTLINQQPAGWTLSWVEPGMPLYGSEDPAGGVPECVHKHSSQLPPDEQLGGTEALILDGEYTYKMFHANQPFGSELVQTIDELVPGSLWRLTAPILVDLHPDKDPSDDPYRAESGVWVNGIGGWATAADMGNRSWYHHRVEFSVPSDGQVTVLIRVKSKWATPKDFFVDDVRLHLLADGEAAAPLPTAQ